MALVNFYRGLKEKYNKTTHADGLFFSTDTQEILLNGKSFGGGSITDASFEDGVLTLTFLSGETKEITFAAATQTTAGLLSAEDKVHLDEAQANIVESASIEGTDQTITDKKLVLDTYSTATIESKIAEAVAAHADRTDNPHAVTKEQVGLGNVTNDAQVKRSEMGVANGVATLDESGLVPSSQLPSYVDDVLEYATKTSFPTTGETGKIYVATDTNLTYRWSGSDYVEISQSLALGETSSTAYAGDKGKANRAALDSNPTNVITDAVEVTTSETSNTISFEKYVKDGDNKYAKGDNDSVTIQAATTKAAGLMSATDKTNLDGVVEALGNDTSDILKKSQAGANGLLTSYTIATADADIVATDTINAGLGKVEKATKTNAAAIAAETTRATAAETTLTTNLEAETERAKAAEAINASNITSGDAATLASAKEYTDTIATNASTALNAEVTRAKAAETTNATAISTEKTRATEAETALDTRITNIETWATIA